MFDLQGFIANCREFVAAPNGARRILDLMRSVLTDAQGIKSAVGLNVQRGEAIFDVPLFGSADLFVLNATIPPHFQTPPHDHSTWAVVGIYEGQENNTFYRRSAKGLEEVNRREIRAGDAVLLGPEVIHAIENPFGSNTLGLHVYGCDMAVAKRSMWHPRTGEELPYEARQALTWCEELTKSRSAV
jgi:predicted metal-dependent enzyme (double-stranded beta helix superfamily)